MRHATLLALTLVLFNLLACGSEETASYESADTPLAAVHQSAEGFAIYEEASATRASDLDVADVSERLETNASDTRVQSAANASAQRKIIFTSDIRLVVDAFEDIDQRVHELAKQYSGFVARSNIQGSDGTPRRGEWTLRIPSEKHDPFVQAGQALGQVRSIRSDSQEVTAEFVDLQARLRNLQAEETRLHEHLSESTKSLKDILAVEREIARVRGEIERSQGRLNVLNDLTSLSTVTLAIEEIKNFVPEPTEEPGFATQVARTWSDSIASVGSFFTRASLLAVGLIPWLVVVLPIGLMLWLTGRAFRRAASRSTAHPTAP
jgi:hypothetical protein